MNLAPSLLDLCSNALAALPIEDRGWHAKALELPFDLLSRIVHTLPPLQLHFLRHSFQRLSDEPEIQSQFSSAWKRFVGKHHPEYRRASNEDWEQTYWEGHVQLCLDSLTAAASCHQLTSDMYDFSPPGDALAKIGLRKHQKRDQYATLRTTLPHFAKYVKFLRIRGAICSPPLHILLEGVELQKLHFFNVKSSSAFHQAFRILQRNIATVQALGFYYCKFSHETFNALLDEMTNSSKLAKFEISCSSFQETLSFEKLNKFLNSNSSLRSVEFSSNRMHTQCTSTFVVELLSCPSLHSLKLADNLLENCFEYPQVDQFFLKCSTGETSFHPSLTKLDLKSCFLKSTCIQRFINYLRCLRCLESLKLSDNPMEDEGIEALASSLQSMPSLRKLKVAGCGLRWCGVSTLFEALISTNHSLQSLSIADNDLGRFGSSIVAKFLLQSHVQKLNISEIGLGPGGCTPELTSALISNQKLEKLKISKNRIKLPGAKLLHEVIFKNRGPLSIIDSSSNILSLESVKLIASAMKMNPGKMKTLGLENNLPESEIPEVISLFPDVPGLKLNTLHPIYLDHDP